MAIDDLRQKEKEKEAARDGRRRQDQETGDDRGGRGKDDNKRHTALFNITAVTDDNTEYEYEHKHEHEHLKKLKTTTNEHTTHNHTTSPHHAPRSTHPQKETRNRNKKRAGARRDQNHPKWGSGVWYSSRICGILKPQSHPHPHPHLLVVP
jgi:hypothetical protein